MLCRLRWSFTLPLWSAQGEESPAEVALSGFAHLSLAGGFLPEVPTHGDTAECDAVQECQSKGRWTEDG